MKALANVTLSVGRILSAFKPGIAAQKTRRIGGMTFVMPGAFMDVLQHNRRYAAAYHLQVAENIPTERLYAEA